MTMKIPHNAIASIPLVFKQDGALACHDPKLSTVQLDDPAIGNVAVTSDGHWIQFTPKVAEGKTTVRYRDASGKLETSIEIEVVPMQATSVTMDVKAIVLEANPNPPQITKASKAQNGASHVKPPAPRRMGKGTAPSPSPTAAPMQKPPAATGKTRPAKAATKAPPAEGKTRRGSGNRAAHAAA